MCGTMAEPTATQDSEPVVLTVGHSTRPIADCIGYEHVAGLGGFRRANPGSPNTGWRNVSFRGFADYMQTPEFSDNLAGLIEQAMRERIVLMCAEAVPWRCHRSIRSRIACS